MGPFEARATNLLDVETDGSSVFSGGDASFTSGEGIITMKALEDLSANAATVSFEGMNSFNYRAGSIEAVAAKALDALGNIVKVR